MSGRPYCVLPSATCLLLPPCLPVPYPPLPPPAPSPALSLAAPLCLMPLLLSLLLLLAVSLGAVARRVLLLWRQRLPRLLLLLLLLQGSVVSGCGPCLRGGG